MKDKDAISEMVNTEGWKMLCEWISEVSSYSILKEAKNWEDYLKKSIKIEAYNDLLARVQEYLQN